MVIQRLMAICGLLLILCTAVIVWLLDGQQAVEGAASSGTWHVSPQGRDSNAGTSPTAAFQSIQKAIDAAQPGETIQLAPGVYFQDIVSRRDGREGAPITIKGPDEAVLKGAGAPRIFEIHHDYLTLDGFTIDGLWNDPATKEGYRDKLLYVQGKQPGNGVNGLKVLNMSFKNAGGECLRMRYFAIGNEVAHSSFVACGMYDFKFNGGGKNGEAIYIGTAPEQRADGKNPDIAVDRSTDNWVHHNTFDTQGNECVDVKEGATANIIEYNRCTGQRDPLSGGFDSRGNGNIFRYNESFGNVGAGVRLGGDTKDDGLDNEVYGNKLYNNRAGGIKLVRKRQRSVCGNTMSGNAAGNVVSDGAPGFDPTVPCKKDGQAAPKDNKPKSGGAAPQDKPKTGAQAAPSTAAQPTGKKQISPSIDTYITSKSPNKRYANEKSVKVDQTPETWSLFRFDLPTGNAPRKVLLQLYVDNSSKRGGDAYLIPTTWDSNVTWSTRPQLGTKVAQIGKANKGKWVTIDLTNAPRSNGALAVAIIPVDEDGVGYRSNEKGKKYAPRLIVEH